MVSTWRLQRSEGAICARLKQYNRLNESVDLRGTLQGTRKRSPLASEA
jgi:hypothetical protein